jgi:hypothetical protein
MRSISVLPAAITEAAAHAQWVALAVFLFHPTILTQHVVSCSFLHHAQCASGFMHF